MDTFTDDYRNLCDISMRMKDVDLNMTYVSISTMTIVCELNIEIDIYVLAVNFKSPTFPHVSISKKFSKKGKNSNFYNCTSLMFQDHSKKNIKVFKNVFKYAN